MSGARTAIRRLVVVAGVSYCLSGIGRAQNLPQQINLPNPTPRDRDLHDVYKDDPTQKIRQQQAAMIRQAQLRQQAVAATDRLAQLAAQLKDDMEKHEPGGPLNPYAQKAAEIEKLAKTVKNSMKSQ
ncbi:MAG TPA: hypothetical protein VF214_03010 [Edaphobacter sp.]